MCGRKVGGTVELREWFTLKSPNKDKGPHTPPPMKHRLTAALPKVDLELLFTDLLSLQAVIEEPVAAALAT